MQMTSSDQDLLSLDHYVQKTFHKTASLMANSCKAIAILGGQSQDVSEFAWQYGKHLGLAFQVGYPVKSCWCDCYGCSQGPLLGSEGSIWVLPSK